ncbi:hypothetical protein MKX03_025730 [Papaver bracteatum]|nr:hypothetical protein MKX03_025730 [Papaver bracteatum]
MTPLLSWIPKAKQALSELPRIQFSELGNELGLKKLVMELIAEVLPELKGVLKESSIDYTDDGDEFSTASARTPVAYAIVAAYQFRWFVTQVEYPHLGKLCSLPSLVIPCALTALDHWSPEVKFHTSAKNVNAAEFGVYEDVILDICCKNIASTDELWRYVVEMSVLLVTCTQRKNPRSSWFERMMNEMLSHLKRQPSHKDGRNSWLEIIEPVFNSMDAFFHFFFKRVQTIIKLVDELTVTYKEAALRRAREEIRNQILQILSLGQVQRRPNLGTLSSSLCKETELSIAH